MGGGQPLEGVGTAQAGYRRSEPARVEPRGLGVGKRFGWRGYAGQRQELGSRGRRCRLGGVARCGQPPLAGCRGGQPGFFGRYRIDAGFEHRRTIGIEARVVAGVPTFGLDALGQHFGAARYDGGGVGGLAGQTDFQTTALDTG